MSTLNVAEVLFDWIDNTMISTLSSGVTNLIALTAIVAGPAVVLYFVIWSLRQLNDEKPYTELVWEFFKLSAVMSFALNASFFVDTVVGFVNYIPKEIASAFTGSADVINIIDNMIEENFQIIQELWSDAKFVKWSGLDVDTFIAVLLAIFVIFVMGGIYIGLSLLVLSVAKLVVMVIVVLGPIFVICAFFRSTNNFFTLWVNQLINYMLLFVIFSLIFTLQSVLVTSIVQVEADGSLPFSTVLAAFIVYLVSIGTIAVIPVLASSLSGGVGLNGVVGGTATAASSLLSKPLGALTKALKNKGGATSTSIGSNAIKSPKLPG